MASGLCQQCHNNQELRSTHASPLSSESKVSINSFATNNSYLTNQKFMVQWIDIKVSVPSKFGPRLVLNGVSGQIDNENVTAILGPSGAGKSTLLNCISGKRQCLSGHVKFYTSLNAESQSENNNATFAYVPQEDHLTPYLTVEETLLLASKLKNHYWAIDHKELVNQLLNDFRLTACRHQYVYKCSGGERKRLSIGCEMISRPSTLLLDEPTSGLDSTTSLKVMEVLCQMQRQTAILISIHQPSSELFHLFSKVYVLAAGSCIYFGRPDKMVDHLKQSSLHCPLYSNPADFVLLVATRLQQHADEVHSKQLQQLEYFSSELSADCLNQDIELKSKRTYRSESDQLLHNLRSKYMEQPLDFNFEKKHLCPVALRKLHQYPPIWKSYPLLSVMFVKSFFRDPLQASFRLLNSLTLPVILFFISSRVVGSERACAFIPLNATHLLPESTFERMDRQEAAVRNVGLTYLDLMFAYFSGMIPAIIAMNVHVNVFRKHLRNGYYGVGVFFSSLVTICTLCTIGLSVINAFCYFFATNQQYTLARLAGFSTLVVLTSATGEYVGLLLNFFFPSTNTAALMLGLTVGFGLYTFCGFFLPIKDMTPVLAYFTQFLFCRHTFEAMLKVIYGNVGFLTWTSNSNGTSGLDFDSGCQLPNHMIFSFDQLRDLFTYYNHEQKKDDALFKHLPTVPLNTFDDIPNKVRVALKQKDWTRPDIMELAEAMNGLDQEQVQRLDSFWDSKMDLVFGNYGINPHGIHINFIAIIVSMLLLIMFCYLVLKIKYKQK